MRNRIAFALYVGPCWEVLQIIRSNPKSCLLKQNPCTAKCRKLYVGKRHGSHGVRRENLSVLYRAYIEELRESTNSCCREIWNNDIRDHVGHIGILKLSLMPSSSCRQLPKPTI